jgi:hypothetical protein
MALARVQTTGKVQADTTSAVACTFASPPSVGNAIVVPVLLYRASTGCTDNRGNTYTLAKAQNGTAAQLAIYYCAAITATGAPFTVTVSGGGTTYFTASAIEISGVGGGLAIDQTAGQTSSGSSMTAPALAALTVAEALLVAATAAGTDRPLITVETVVPAWTQEVEELSSLHAVGETDTRIVTGALGTTPGCTWASSGPTGWAAAIVAFKATSGGGGGGGAQATPFVWWL